jgi:ABC-type Fe3+-hydroxamate transport system substrate-binding protein
VTDPVLDDFGNALRLPGPPRRLVSLVPGLTETVFALGAGDRLAAVTDYCNHPAEATRLPRIGGVLDPRVDEILDLEPDLVLASVSENERASIDALRARGVPVFLTGPDTVDQALRSMRILARALGLETEGEARVRALEETLGSVPETGGPLLPVLFPLWIEPVVLPGAGTFVSDLLRRGGARSVGEALGPGWPRADEAFLRTCGARAVFLPSEPYAFGDADRERWMSVEGLEVGVRVYLVDGEKTNRPGPRMAEGVAAVRDLVKRARSAGEDAS